ncbi:MAG: plasmid mobilization relaxosome protein MobC [Bacteroidaceae bacterium]|nr:plasmid mobilization relaxosome protein MobC [Bacteroidaceae bacterium]
MEKRNQYIQIMVSARERQAIEDKMKQLGIKNMSAYMRKMALNGYYIMLDLSELKEILRLLRYCSNNINQYARKANETGSIYKADVEDIKNCQEELWKMMKELLSRLANI